MELINLIFADKSPIQLLFHNLICMRKQGNQCQTIQCVSIMKVGLFLLVIFTGCSNLECEDDFLPSDYVTLIIQSDTLLQTRIQTSQSYWNYNNFEVVSHSLQDTLFLPVRGFDLIRILNPTVNLDSIIVRAGDTLYLDILCEGYIRRHFRDGLLCDETEIANHFKIANSNSATLDSLQNLFFYVDYSWPFDLALDETRFTDYPVIPVLDNIANKPDILKTYVKLSFEDFQKRYQERPSEVPIALHQLYAEIYLSRIMGNLVFLYRQKPYDFLQNGLFSDVFLNYRKPELIPVWFVNQQISILEQEQKKSKGLHKPLIEAYDNALDYWPEEIWLEYASFYILSKLVDLKVSENLLDEKIEHFSESFPKSKFSEKIAGVRYSQQTQSDFLLNAKDSLVHRSGKAITFPDLLNEHRGKYIFIDFWASWCAPCVRALPDIVNIKNKMGNTDIIFIFISIDENENVWRNAEERLISVGYEYSFVSPGFSGSALQKEFNIQQIPRYVLFDREGRLLLNQSGLTVEEISGKLSNLK